MKKILVILVCIVLATGCQNNDDKYEEKFKEYENKINKLETIIKDIETSKEESITELNNELDEYKSNNEELQKEIAILNNKMENNTISEKEKQTYIEKINSLKQEIETLNKKVEEPKEDKTQDIFRVRFNSDYENGFAIPYRFSGQTYNANSAVAYSYIYYDRLYKNGEKYFSDSKGYVLAEKKYPIHPGEELDYTFEGWYTEKDCKGTKIENDTVVNLTESIELHACYKDIEKD